MLLHARKQQGTEFDFTFVVEHETAWAILTARRRPAAPREVDHVVAVGGRRPPSMLGLVPALA